MEIQKNIMSPVTGSENCEKIKSFPVGPIIESYRNDLEINVEEYFKNIIDIDLYKCNDSGLRFFIPDQIQGNGEFYTQLQRHSWYYLPIKWEHKETFNYLPIEGKLLEIGCAEGAFLSIVKNKGIKVEGIELNTFAADQARKKGLKVHTQLLSEFISTPSNKGTFDVVCAYQVLEHISNVKQFIEEAIACLKPGGLLIISVPDMNTFLKYDNGGILNFPPHHQGWYTHDVMKNISKIYSLDLIKVSTEKLQVEHYNWFHKNMLTKWYNKNKLIGSMYFRTTMNPSIRKILTRLIVPFTNGHTLMAVYRKK
jgi:2-polyprenyl-3-methyl-5-hydroxy-6-metoxy-1,4-benzoquinol methylase